MEINDALGWLRNSGITGVEGLVIKPANSLYLLGTHAWTKVRPRETAERVIVLSRCAGLAGLCKAGCTKLTAIVTPRAPRMGARLVEQIFNALDAQTVVVPGTTAAEMILPRLADSLRDLLRQREQVEGMLDAHPLSSVLISMPGVGIGTAARILLEVGDISACPTSGHLAACAGWPR